MSAEERYYYQNDEPDPPFAGLDNLASLVAKSTFGLPEAPMITSNEPAGSKDIVDVIADADTTPPSIPIPIVKTKGPPPSGPTPPVLPKQPVTAEDIPKPPKPPKRPSPATAPALVFVEPPIASALRERVAARTVHAVDLLSGYVAAARANPDAHFLRTAQIPVFESMLTAFQNEGADLKGYFSLPTGSGKSVIYTELIKLTDMQTLIATPTQHLVDSIVAAFNKFNNKGDRRLDVGRIYTGLSQARYRVKATTYASLKAHTFKPRADGIRPQETDLLILDEAHNALSKQNRIALQSYDHAVQLGFTATENYSDHRKLSSLLPTEIHKLTILEACSFGLIAPYSNWVLKTGLDISKVRINSRKEYETDELQAKINNPERNALVATLYKNHFKDQKAFVFCSGIEHAVDMSLMLLRMGINAAAVHSGLSTDERKQILKDAAQRTSSSIQILCSDQMLTEGTDLDNFSVCINAVPVLGSFVRAQQRGGRCLRLDPEHPDKRAVIVDIIDNDYRLAPLLFCHEAIGQTAHFGTRTATEPLSIPYGDNRQAHLITDPDTVEALAETYNNQRIPVSTTAQGPPSGWKRAEEIAETWGMSMRRFSERMRYVRRQPGMPDYRTHTGKFREGSELHKLYYSPEFYEAIERLWQYRAEQSAEDPAPPKGWMNLKQIEAWYDLNNSEGLALNAKHPHAGVACIPPYSKAKIRYYSPELVESFVTSIGKEYIPPDGIPPRWQTLQGDNPYFETGDDERAIAIVGRVDKAFAYNHTVTRDSLMYCSPIFKTTFQYSIDQAFNWRTAETAAQELGIDTLALKRRLYSRYGDNPNVLARHWIPPVLSVPGGGLISPILYKALITNSEPASPN